MNLEIHNEVTPGQLALTRDDRVYVLRDSGLVETRRVKYPPWRLGDGTWVVGVYGLAGGYALCRVTPAPERGEGVALG